MLPFSVICETCGAKLKVRDPEAIGQIHACPKCESMVLIAAPAAAIAPTPATPAATPTPDITPLADGFVAPSDFGAEIDDLLGEADPAPSSADSTAASVEPAMPAPEPAMAAAAPVAPDHQAYDEALADQLQDTPSPADEPLPEPASRTMTLAIGIGGSVACFALGLLAAAWFLGGGDDTSPAANQVASVTEPDVQATEKPTSTFAEEEQPLEVQKPVVETAPDADVTSQIGEAVAEQTTELPAPLPELPPVTADPLPDLNETPEPAPEEPAADPWQPLDPLAIDSANLDLLLIPDAEETEPTTAEVPPATEPISVVPQPTDMPPQVAEPPRELRFEPGKASRGPSYSEDFGTGQLNARLESTLPAVSWRNVPLNVALDELSRLANVPMTLDPAALRMTGVAATKPISVDASDATVLDVVKNLAGEVRLEAEVVPSGIVLAKGKIDQWREVTYKLNDLCDDDDATPLAELIRKFVEPGTWDEPETKLEVQGSSLVINQPIAVHYDILIFCERLRKARGLSIRSKYPADLLATKLRLAQLAKPLDKSTTFAFVDWTPLAEVFSYWQQSSELVLLVDWQHLADQDLRPMATMAASVENVKWRSALDTCLEPLDLDWVPVDGKTLHITTRDQAELDCWVEFYPGAEAEQLRDAIESQADAVTLGGLAIESDPTGRFVIVRGNRHVHELAIK